MQKLVLLKERKDRETEKKERERERRREMQRVRMNHELNLKEMELSTGRTNQTHTHMPFSDDTKHIRLVPPFQEKEVDKYFGKLPKILSGLKKKNLHSRAELSDAGIWRNENV